MNIQQRMKMSDLGCVSRSLEALVAELVAPPDYNPTVASHAPRSRTKNQTGQPRRRNAKRKAGGRRAGVAPFIKKIFQITNDPRYTSIYWTPKGNSFVINKDTFEDEFLRLDKVQKKPIQTNEFPSFVRQLNLYGFRKVREQVFPTTLNHYTHKDLCFARGKENLLTQIVRMGSTRETDAMSTAATVVGSELSHGGLGHHDHHMEHDTRQKFFGGFDYPPEHHHGASIYSGLPSPFAFPHSWAPEPQREYNPHKRLAPPSMDRKWDVPGAM